MNHTDIPQTDSIQELAHFWDTHDLTDFEDELEEVSVPVFERKTMVIVRLCQFVIHKLQKPRVRSSAIHCASRIGCNI